MVYKLVVKFKGILMLFALLIFIVIFNYFSFNNKPKRAMYFWKTVFELTDIEQKTLQQSHIKKLYVRFFDVKKHPTLGFAVPIGELKIKSKLKKDIEIVPVVYILNEVFKTSTNNELQKLAQSIAKLSSSIYADISATPIKELQIDCDWTAQSKEKYFYFLNELQTQNPSVKLSVTLRLHQFSNQYANGIPPVKSVSLMCYNLQKINSSTETNSILDTTILKTYFTHTQQYPLPMSIALPVFSWTVVFRNQKSIGISYHFTAADFAKLPLLKLSNNQYKVLNSFAFHNNWFQKDDVLKYEKTTPQLINSAAKFLNKTLSNSISEIIIFDLNERYLQTNFKQNEIENIYNSFNAVPIVR